MTISCLIPTQHKDRLPPGFSFPLKASELTTFLQNVREFERCSIYFSDRPIFWKSQFQKTVRDKGEVSVFRLQDMYLDEGITITVNAVQSDHRISVRDAILSTHSSEINGWFALSPTYLGQKSIGRPPLDDLCTLASRKSRTT